MAEVELWLTVVFACCIGAGLISGSPLQAFPDLDSAIGVRAARLSRDADLVMHTEMFALFRDLNFTCNGRIIRWWMIGRIQQAGGIATARRQLTIPQLSIQNGPESTVDSYGPEISDDIQQELNQSSNVQAAQLLYSFFDNSTIFENGTFLKISRSSTRPRFDLYYSAGNGPEGTFAQEPDEDVPFVQVNDYPLIAVETYPPGCSNGFLNVTYLESIVASVTTFDSRHRIVAGHFGCSGRLTAVTIVAMLAVQSSSNEALSPTQLLLCRQESDSTDDGRTEIRGTADPSSTCSCEQRISIDITNMSSNGLEPTGGNTISTVQPNIYRIVLEEPIQVGLNNILAVSQPDEESSRLYFARNELTPFTIPQGCTLTSASTTPPTMRDLPLVTVDMDEDCAEGFISEESLINRALLIVPASPISSDGRQFVFPSMTFNTSGFIKRWIFAAQFTGTEDDFWPELQLWRREESPENPNKIQYSRNASSILENPQPLLGFLNVYFFTPNPRLEFQAGDILGVYQPMETSLQLLSVPGNGMNEALVMRTMESTIQAQDSDMMQVLPLVTIEVEQQGTEDTRSTATTTQPPPLTTDFSTPAGQAALPVAAIAGGVAGGVVLLLLAILVLLMVVVLVTRKRRQKRRTLASREEPREALENPVYICDSDRSGDLRPALSQPENYEVPLQSFTARNEHAIYQTVNTAQEYEAPLVSREGNNAYHVLEKSNPPNNEYHVLEQKPTSEYHTLEGPLAGTGPYAEEYEVFVPTREERKAIPGNINGRAVYASLKESQSSSLRSNASYFVESETYWKPASNANQIYQQLATRKYREIPRHQIQISNHLGSGQFGTVSKGTWQTGSGANEVAIKMLKRDATEVQKVKFLQEAAIMGQFLHPNVVKLHGVVTVGEPNMIVLELLSNGDLRKYLTKQKTAPGEMPPPDWPGQFLGFCQHVAAGMDYLSKKGFIHRDLAARNILVAADSMCKIADFGMSRDLEDESYYISQGGVIPVKWTAPEAIHYRKYSTASDVWSFGVVMYEIWSVGGKPFKGRNSQKALELVESGFRLPPPSGCPKEIYKLMIKCWNPQATSRPTFVQLMQLLSASDSALLSWSEEDIAVHPQAAVLGAPLDAGKHLYKELQTTYQTS